MPKSSPFPHSVCGDIQCFDFAKLGAVHYNQTSPVLSYLAKGYCFRDSEVSLGKHMAYIHILFAEKRFLPIAFSFPDSTVMNFKI